MLSENSLVKFLLHPAHFVSSILVLLAKTELVIIVIDAHFISSVIPGNLKSVSELITLYNVCAVPWGVLSTVGGVQYRGGISHIIHGVNRFLL